MKGNNNIWADRDFMYGVGQKMLKFGCGLFTTIGVLYTIEYAIVPKIKATRTKVKIRTKIRKIEKECAQEKLENLTEEIVED